MNFFQEHDGRYVYRRRSWTGVVVGISLAMGFMAMAAVVFFIMAGKPGTGSIPSESIGTAVPIVVISLAVNAMVMVFIIRKLRAMNTVEIDQMERTVTFFEQGISSLGMPSRGRRTTLEIDRAEAITVTPAPDTGPVLYGGQRYSLDLIVEGERKPILKMSDRAELDGFASEFSTITGLTIR